MGKPLCPIYPNDALIRRLSFRVWLLPPWESLTRSLLPFLWLSFRRKGNAKSKGTEEQKATLLLGTSAPPEPPSVCPNRPVTAVVSMLCPAFAGDEAIYIVEWDRRSDSDSGRHPSIPVGEGSHPSRRHLGHSPYVGQVT